MATLLRDTAPSLPTVETVPADAPASSSSQAEHGHGTAQPKPKKKAAPHPSKHVSDAAREEMLKAMRVDRPLLHCLGCV